jgi:hypothetical protein
MANAKMAPINVAHTSTSTNVSSSSSILIHLHALTNSPSTTNHSNQHHLNSNMSEVHT